MSTGNYMYFAPFVTAVICRALLFVPVRIQSLPKDLPNDRSLHSAPVTRSARTRDGLRNPVDRAAVHLRRRHLAQPGRSAGAGFVCRFWVAIYLALAAMVNKKWASHTAGKQHDSA